MSRRIRRGVLAMTFLVVIAMALETAAPAGGQLASANDFEAEVSGTVDGVARPDVDRPGPSLHPPATFRSAPVPRRPTPLPASTSVPVPADTGREAPPTPTVAPTPTPNVATVEGRGQVALESLDYDAEAELPDWTIAFLGERPGYRGLTYTKTQRIEVYVRPTDSHADLRRIIAHELGHAVDVERNTWADRDSWLEARGIVGAPWWPSPGRNDFATGAGDFAECFSTWLADTISESSIAGPCTGAQVALVVELSQ